jgi:ABC-type lipoprotein release transport system permease subunit
MDNYLSVRGFMRQSGKIQWAPFDKVEFLEFSPGERIYERVKLAHKMASRTEDIERLGRILTECDRDIRAILEPLATGPEPSERFERVNRTGARIILYEYLTGAGAAVGAIRYHYRDVVGVLSNLHGEEVLSPAQRAAVKALWDGLNARTDAALDLCKEPATEEAARESEILAMARDYEAQLDAAIARAETQAHREILDRLRQLRASLPDANTLQPMRNKLRNRQPLPLSVAAQRYEKGSQATARRMEAYSRALPLRTTMDDDESVEDYIARSTKAGLRPANDKPGIILGDALAEVALGTGIVVGDSISVMVPHIYYERGRLMARTSEVWFQVTGFFRSGLYEENRSRMYCDFEELTSLLADTEIRYVLGVRLADYSQYEGQRRSDELKTGVRQSLRDAGINQFRVSVWEDESRTLLEAVNTERTLIGLIVSFIIALTGGVIFILVYQLVNEKVKDIGILKALGYSPWGIRSVFMFNALFIGLFGAIAGGAAGMLTSEYLNSVEDFIDSATGVRLFPPEIYYLTYIPSIKGWALIELALSIVVPVVLFSFLCGIYPALLAAKKDPVEALHYE